MVYFCKGFDLPKWVGVIRILFVLRKKQFYDKNCIGIWWKLNIGTGIIGKPNKELKYLMIGLSFISLRFWVEFKYIGKAKKPNNLKLKD